ncbi:sterol esterase [Coniophora puteana RWD-64-598 SS2]|uniref:Carboxylic ester hydrolase n=1 Tax=Coniophora puteana (strain RWD-64-598) TaxID=741705 RepID=A0A5M3MH80_CONPW|nr:sterol esterase [Coniophora puteana RWD-64-598 SS2]EIW78572.1 sterol esterase [Coniophora puteana RWD-64-598 SS2]
MRASISALLPFVSAAIGASIWRRDGPPTVSLDYATFQGFSSVQDTESFYGIPFAQPPVGKLRFALPHAPAKMSGVQNATAFKNGCPQQPVLAPNGSFPTNPGLNGILPYLAVLQPHGIVATSEDCLYLNLVRPANTTADSKLPVVVWIYGGAFEAGDASSTNGTDIVGRSLDLGQPVIQLSFNYRMNAFGFLGGAEIKAAGLGNAGLWDQYAVLQWVQKYISSFGGDPNRVIIWGQSSGSISCMLQMVHNPQTPLFHGAVMESGTASALKDISTGQDNFDFIVAQTNCTSAADKLDCLRDAPYDAILNAVLATPALLDYRALNTSWHAFVDGTFLTQSAQQALASGAYARVPIMTGDVDDEGTLFSLFNLNVTTDAEFSTYIQEIFFPSLPASDIAQLATLYPADPALGSPYDMGTQNALTPEYKRISSFQGDYYFHAPRRLALDALSQTQKTWSWIWRRNKYVPGVGSFHESDLQEFYNLNNTDFAGTDALLNFAYNLDPNVPQGGYATGAKSVLADVQWPTYDGAKQLLSFYDTEILNITTDDFRVQPIQFLQGIQKKLNS